MTAALSESPTSELFSLDRYRVRRKVLKLFGGRFHVYAGDRVVGFSKQKAFALKEDIRVFADESMAREILAIRARQVVDFKAAYDILDPVTGVKVGAARRRGFASIVRDSRELLDAEDRVLGKLQEDSLGMALLRRFLANFVPQRFRLAVHGAASISFRQDFNPFIYRLNVAIPASHPLDRRLVFALAVLICAIEGLQS